MLDTLGVNDWFMLLKCHWEDIFADELGRVEEACLTILMETWDNMGSWRGINDAEALFVTCVAERLLEAEAVSAKDQAASVRTVKGELMELAVQAGQEEGFEYLKSRYVGEVEEEPLPSIDDRPAKPGPRRPRREEAPPVQQVASSTASAVVTVEPGRYPDTLHVTDGTRHMAHRRWRWSVVCRHAGEIQKFADTGYISEDLIDEYRGRPVMRIKDPPDDVVFGRLKARMLTAAMPQIREWLEE